MTRPPLSVRRANELIVGMALANRKELTIVPVAGGYLAEVGAKPGRGEVLTFDTLPDAETLRARFAAFREARQC